MDKVKQMVAVGVSVSTAIREALGITDVELARRHGLNKGAVSNQIAGRVRPTSEFVAALIAELGGAEAEWRELLWLAGKPEHVELPKAV